MSDRYEVLSKFNCVGKKMVTVKIRGNVHVMDEQDLKWWFGMTHPDRWGANVA